MLSDSKALLQMEQRKLGTFPISACADSEKKEAGAELQGQPLCST